MFCTNCGLESNDKDKFCSNCGNALRKAESGNEKKEEVNDFNIEHTIRIEPIKEEYNTQQYNEVSSRRVKKKNEVSSRRAKKKKNSNRIYKTIAIIAASIIILIGSGLIGYKLMYPNEVLKEEATKKQDVKIREAIKQNNIKEKASNKEKSISELINDKNGFIMPESNSKNLTSEDLKSYSKDELALIRNEVYARYGYIFKDRTYKEHFTAKSWYRENPSFQGNESELNQYEKGNIKLIKSLEGN